MHKQASETDRFLKALRTQHDGVYENLGDQGLYGAMSNYTGESHLGNALLSGLGTNALTGAGVGALSSAFLLPALGMKAAPANYFKAGALGGLGAGASLSALGAIAKYYLGKNTARSGE